jgi:LSU ribosomal protein L18P
MLGEINKGKSNKMINKQDRKATRVTRHQRIRRRVTGTTERPRLCVYRSNKHIYAQIIDDSSALTLVAASTLDADVKKAARPGT